MPATPGDPDSIFIGSTGEIYVAPVGTAAPTDVTTAFSGTWTKLGLTTPDGATPSPSQDMLEVEAWQAPYPVRRKRQSKALDISFTLIEMTKAAFILAMGGGTIATAAGIHKYVPPDEDDLDERALAIHTTDGAKKYRLIVPRGIVAELAEFQFSRGQETRLDVNFSVLFEQGVDPFYVLTDDPAWAA